MKTVICILFIFIVTIVLSLNAIAQDGYYFYGFGDKIEMIINRNYIAVKIDETNFTNWESIYSSETALNDSEPPKYLTDDIYRLKVSNLEETDNLVTSIASYDGIIETNYCFVTEDGMDYYLGKYLEVKFKEDISKLTIDSIIKANGLEISRISKLVPSMYFLENNHLTKPQIISLGNDIYENGFADFATISFIAEPVLFSAQNDTYYPDQYSLHPDHCDFEEAYEYTLTDDTILVAFLDTGLEPHEDFPAERIKCGGNYLGYYPTSDYSLVDNCQPMGSACYHGMATVGIFGATINNSMGVAGACNNVQVIMNKIIDGITTPPSASCQTMAFEDAVDSGAVIISNSWGYNTCTAAANFSLYYAISVAVASGVVVVWSSGNCSEPWPAPACGDCCEAPSDHPDVIAVGATTMISGGRWSLSAYKFGAYDLDVCAPGENMFSLDQMGDPGQYPPKPCVGDNNYSCMMSGTSYAAPLVSGLAAMIMARRPDFIGQPDSIKQIIYHSTGNGWHTPPVEDAHDSTYQMGHGRINAARAMLAISRGDVDNTVALNILDVLYIIAYKYDGGPPPTPNPMLGDADCSGHINILDAVYLINHISNGGPRPPLCYKY